MCRSKLKLPFALVGALTMAMGLLAVLALSGCRTMPALPPADFSGPGWRVQEGQAIWKPTKNRPELAGELLLATNANGNFFVQFTKPPFALATAQIANGKWEIIFGDGKHSWRGPGEPPSRFVWFQLPGALNGQELSKGWQFRRLPTDSWRLENPRTGETLEGGFFP